MKRVILLISTSILFSSIIRIPIDYATIQAGLNSATTDDTVQVSTGVYVENITWPVTNGIKLIGEDRETTILDGNHNGSVIRFDESLDGIIDTTTLITGFTIQYGLALDGGGLYCYAFSPSLTNLTVINNSAQNGGGLYCYQSNPSLTNVTITNNVASENGGGLYCGTYSSP